MPGKNERLDQLITQALARLEALQTQNKALAERVRTLEMTADKLKEAETEIKNLRAWKKNTQNTLRRLSAKIDKELGKQP